MKKFLFVVYLVLLMAARAPAAPPPKTPILFDTDIGTDLDDAFALALILESPELDLRGVTTVSGDTAARARLAAKLLREAGHWDVPVAAGEPGRHLPIEQTRWAEGYSSPQVLQESAVEFLKSQIDRQPGEITFVAIGPLSNLGALLDRDPATARKIKRIVLMGGSIARGYSPGSGPAAEYNIASDPGAAQTVFSSGAPILMVPLDVTAMLELDAAGRHRVFTRLAPLTNALTLLYHLWNRETLTLFDPMAAGMVVDPSLCETKELAIEVDAQGYTRVAPGKSPNATVALHTNPQKFFAFYLDRVAPASFSSISPR